MSNVIALHTHPIARERAASEQCAHLAKRMQLAPRVAARLAADTRALIRAGCSAAWSIHIARRTARRAAAQPESA